jgi:hypothetical protein
LPHKDFLPFLVTQGLPSFPHAKGTSFLSLGSKDFIPFLTLRGHLPLVALTGLSGLSSFPHAIGTFFLSRSIRIIPVVSLSLKYRDFLTFLEIKGLASILHHIKVTFCPQSEETSFLSSVGSDFLSIAYFSGAFLIGDGGGGGWEA